jgi:chromosome segregation protein
MVTAIAAMFEGSRVHDAIDKTNALVARIVAAQSGLTWLGVCDGILETYRRKILSGSPEDPSEDDKCFLEKLLFDGNQVTPLQARRIYSSLTDDTVAQVLAATPRDQIVLSYMDEGKAISFHRASPGQQASALLELLLRQEAGPLVIDQPEDDLDNKVIMKIVELIRTSKNRRQLVFATHNANLVVNGDADKIVSLRSTSGGAATADSRVGLDGDGAIETSEIRETITQIMEGGREAFDLRSRKYGFVD